MTSCIDRVRKSFEDQRFMGFIGARLGEVSEGRCEILLPFRHDLTQQHGFFHGGIVATLADNAGGFAGYTMMSDSEQPLSVEFKINLLSKAVGDGLVARARVLKNGRRIKVCQTDVYCHADGVETLCAVALVSVIATRV